MGNKKLRDTLKRVDLDLIYVSINPILSMIEMFDDIIEKLKNHLIRKKNMTLSDIWITLNLLLKRDMPEGKLFNKLVNEAKFGDILANIKSDRPRKNTEYYGIQISKVRSLHNMPHVIHQIKSRKMSEMQGNIGLATNSLLNEIHAICFHYDKEADKIDRYDANDVVAYLLGINAPHGAILSVRNLFDVRNMNPISHPGSDSSPTKTADPDEYKQLRRSVGLCVEQILTRHL